MARGSAAVEFALVFPLVAVLLLGLMEVALIGKAQIEVVAAAREGARQAAVDPDPARAVEAARAALGPAGDTAVVSVVRPEPVGAPAEVSIRLPYGVASRVFGGFSIELRATSRMRVER